MLKRIEDSGEKKLVGKCMKMSYADNRTGDLWRSFMPLRIEIKNSVGSELYSVEIYDPKYFDNIDPETEFEKWAAVEVTDFEVIPDETEPLTVPAGLYAVFLHRGPARSAPRTYRYIFETWLPGSGYRLDDRPHLAVMGKKYKNDDPYSEEELWIPVKRE